MDGLVSNFALISGVAGGHASNHVIVLAGLAGLAAGSFSMAVGEYTSVASQTELTLAEIEVERRELELRPHAEIAELAGLYRSRGLSPELAEEVARQLSKNPERALEIHAREELGVDPHSLPSPVLAAVSSFVCFALGALLPLLPFLFGPISLWPSAIVSALGLFGAGALVSLVTTRSWWFSGLRQLVLGASAAAITYGVGVAVGAGVG
jgi:VIT1/CCC1 family predicted Fe2+/Mn2+ transporter